MEGYLQQQLGNSLRKFIMQQFEVVRCTKYLMAVSDK